MKRKMMLLLLLPFMWSTANGQAQKAGKPTYSQPSAILPKDDISNKAAELSRLLKDKKIDAATEVYKSLIVNITKQLDITEKNMITARDEKDARLDKQYTAMLKKQNTIYSNIARAYDDLANSETSLSKNIWEFTQTISANATINASNQ